MKGSSSVPFMPRENSLAKLKEPFMIRRHSTTDKLYNDMTESPLFDLAPVALPGISSRVSRNFSVSMSLDRMHVAFEGGEEEDELVRMEGGYTTPLMTAAALAVISSWNYGFIMGSMNTPGPTIRETLGIPPENGTDADFAWSLCVSIFCLGALVGCAAAAPMANSLGRSKTILLASATCTLGAALEAASAYVGASGVMAMLAGRVLTGCASGASTVVVPIYLGELAPPHLRGTLGVMFQLACVFALLSAQVMGLPSLMGTPELWPLYIFGGVAVPSALQFLLSHLMVESPAWLAGRGAEEGMHAERILLDLRGISADIMGPLRDSVTKELDYMQMAALNSGGGTEGGATIGALLSDKKLRPSVVITIVCAMAQQFSGINNAFNFSTTFLSQNGIDAATVTIVAVLMNVGNVLITALSAWLMDIAGRKPLILGSTLGMSVAIVMLTIALTNPGQPWTAPFAVFAVVSFVMSFGVGMGPVPWLLPAELFPPDKTAAGSSFNAICNWLANFAVGLVFLPLSAALGGTVFMPFLLVLLPFAVFLVVKVPETRGKTVQQILSELSRQ
eukprot:CAMPEP_0115846448 /NCGR_PEP_ID=MMETSP0287-20121206/9867_1 /TAXON_ID=412157 /ORGANISM="Chrysochromulina rotalis, Strain UIO044" /LENGTH=562 /DNA_ID=CAMNT_0003300241 /DNA_START=33 /DNA_END=1721 /DNA_ORIENTATION=-